MSSGVGCLSGQVVVTRTQGTWGGWISHFLSQGSFLPNLTYHMLSKSMVATS